MGQEAAMPKGKFICECDECHRMIFQGIESGGKIFCDWKCLEAWRRHNTVPSTRDESTTMAREFLTEDLKCDEQDPDFQRWMKRTERLFQRYAKIAKVCPQPMTDWGDEHYETTDKVLDKLESQIKAAEEVLGIS